MMALTITPSSLSLSLSLRKAKEHIANYRRFHRYWKAKCDPLMERSGGSEACCVTATYEDLQDKTFLYEYFYEATKIWLGVRTDRSGVVATAVKKAISLKPPKHEPPATAHRYTADHYAQLFI